MPPGHNPTRFYALLPLLAALALLQPTTFNAIAMAVGTAAALRQLY